MRFPANMAETEYNGEDYLMVGRDAEGEPLKIKLKDAIGHQFIDYIKPTDAAPTPARNGNYTFSIGGNKPAWLTAEAGVTTVKAGDGVAVVYAAPSSYSYTHVDINSQTLQKIAQTLTTAEQLQVRQNIAAASVDSLLEKDNKPLIITLDSTGSKAQKMRNVYVDMLIDVDPAFWSSTYLFNSVQHPIVLSPSNNQFTSKVLNIYYADSSGTFLGGSTIAFFISDADKIYTLGTLTLLKKIVTLNGYTATVWVVVDWNALAINEGEVTNVKFNTEVIKKLHYGNVQTLNQLALLQTQTDGKLDKIPGSNLLDPSKFRYGYFFFAGRTAINGPNYSYGITDYIPADVSGLVTSGVGVAANGLSSHVVYNPLKVPLRSMQGNQYNYVDGDGFVVFCYQINNNLSFANTKAVVKGNVYSFSEYTAYKPISEVSARVTLLEESVGSSIQTVDLTLATVNNIYTVCNDININRNYSAQLWIDHLIYNTAWRNKPIGFGNNLNKHVSINSPLTSTVINGGVNKLEQVLQKNIVSKCELKNTSLSIKHRSTKASASKASFPKVLVIGDSVTDGYLASMNKADPNLPNCYWSWVKYLFELDRIDGGNLSNEYNTLMVGMPYPYGSTSTFVLNSTTFTNFAVGKGGWSANDMNSPYFENVGNINPFYDEITQKFSITSFLSKYKTLSDDGKTRLEIGTTAGTEVTNVNAWNVCTPTHVVINLNHNSSLTEYQENIPAMIATIRAELPTAIIILMVIDETGTYFPTSYPDYLESEIAIGGLHDKNVSIYNYIKSTLENEANNVYLLGANFVQHPVKSFPTLEFVGADSIGRAKTDRNIVYNSAYGSGPTYHPNNYAHAAWGYSLYSLIKYTLTL